MKYLFATLALVLCLSTCGHAQPSIEYKPGRTDSARWVLERDGQTFRQQEYDTLTNTIIYGQTLFNQGGFIGGGVVAPVSDFYDEKAIQFISTVGIPMSEDRQIIAGNLAVFGGIQASPLSRDTSMAQELIGNWSISGPSCGMPSDTMKFYFAPDSTYLRVQASDDSGDFDSILTIGDGVVNFFSDPFGEQITIVRIDDETWAGANGCRWTKVQE